jgi:hypothetical protein
LVDAAHADEITAISGSVVPSERKRRRAAITRNLSYDSSSGDGAIEQHHAGISAEVEGAVKRVDG